MEFSAIYKIQSKVHPDRFYIGSAVQVKSRWCLHLADLRKNKHHSYKLQNHYNKYCKDDLVFIVIEPCFPEFLVIREQYYIDSLNPFFNINKIANSSLGIKRSKETRDKISKARKGKPCPTKGIKRKKMSPEFCKQKAEYMKGNKLNKGKHWKWTEEQIKKLSGENNHFFGKKHPPEIMQKIINANKGHLTSEETRKKLSKAAMGRKHSEVSKEKMRLAHLGKKRLA